MTSIPDRTVQWVPAAAGGVMVAMIVWLQPDGPAARGILLTALGFAAGFSLYHAAFGFAGGWRRFLRERDARALRAQLLLIGLVLPFSHALISTGLAAGWIVPIGPALVGGAFLFGIGMQLAGGCGTGTLFTAGGGSVRMCVALAFFVAGSLAGTAPGLTGAGWPVWPAMSLSGEFGAAVAVLLGWGALAVLALLAGYAERRRSRAPEGSPGTWSILAGPWPLWLGALALAAVAVGTFIVAGRPWGITQAFALWGAKLAALAGVDVALWPYWQGGRAAQLQAPVMADTTSVMDLALMAGALAASALAGRFRPNFSLSRRDLATAAAGGLLMGYGARLSSGCNIGALLGGITSGSLHGWIWFAAAFAGSAVWLRIDSRLRPAPPQNAPS